MCGGTIWKFPLRVSARKPLLPAEPLASTFCRVLLHPAFSHSLGRRFAGPSRRPAPGWRLWWHRWLCARPSPEGRGPVAAQAGPAEAGVGRLGLGEDGRVEPRRKQPGRQDPGLRPRRSLPPPVLGALMCTRQNALSLSSIPSQNLGSEVTCT